LGSSEWESGVFSSAEWAHPDIEFELVGGPDPIGLERDRALADLGLAADGGATGSPD
jgi:hypothetical protein